MTTIVETTNTAQLGDFVIHANTSTGEEYVIRGAKFPKLHDVASKTVVGVPTELMTAGFFRYELIPEVRQAIVVTREVLELFKQRGNPTQSEFYLTVTKLPTVRVAKTTYAFAREVRSVEPIVTRTQKGEEPEFYFVAPWGGTMPVALDDVIIVSAVEAYRISRAEFNQTYVFV